jgi:hypothetical protein
MPVSSQVSVTGLSSIVFTLSGHTLENVHKHNSSTSQFHSEFLGMSMAVEESKWRSTQQSVSTLESDGYRMDIDQINPGCYMLDIGIQRLPFKFQTIWIRTEYIRIYDNVQHCHGESSRRVCYFPRYSLETGNEIP